jgi:hypothetical protein
MGKVYRSINFSSLFYVFALSLFETLHSINNLAVHGEELYRIKLSVRNGSDGGPIAHFGQKGVMNCQLF